MSLIAACVSLVCLAVGARPQETPRLPHASPCPAVYSYGWEPAGGWHGVITIVPPARFSEVQLVLRMTVPYYRPEAGVGRVEVKGGTPEVQAISHRAYRGETRPIQYRVVFPPSNNPSEVPRLQVLFINGKIFCEDHQVYADTRSTIELKYTLRTGLNLPLANGNEFSVVITAPPMTPVSHENPTSAWQEQADPELITRRPRPRPSPSPRPTTTPAYEDYEDTPATPTEQFQVDGLNCGVPRVRHNYLVLGGSKAEKGQWPWQAAMFKTSSTGLTFQCGGTLVSKRHVITAAHCVYLRTKKKAVEADSLLIYLGKQSLRSWTEEGQQAMDVDKIIVHPNYGKKNQNFDVAILILSTSAAFTDLVLPVCLWDRSSSLGLIVDTPGTVVGWGRDENGDIANELKTAKMPVVSQETCLRSDEFYTVFTSDVTFCAGYRNGTSVCNGDSGGGMFFYLDNPKQHVKTWYTRGVVSISKLQVADQTCDDNNYVVFTDLAKMLPWLRRQLTTRSNIRHS